MIETDEELLWVGIPSQVVNAKDFIICGLLFWLIIPIFYALWKWLKTENTLYKVTTERIFIKTGILSKLTQEIELYRVKDYTIEEPFFMRFWGLGNVVLTTSDKSIPIVIIEAIGNADELRNDIRMNVERLRVIKGVREVDYEG